MHIDPNQMQIGEVAERTGLSRRTIRYYGEMGLVPPSAHSAGGFRLYTEADVARFRIIARMKPLDFSIEEIKDVLNILDGLAENRLGTHRNNQDIERLAVYLNAARARARAIRELLGLAKGFAAHLQHELSIRTGQ